MIEADFRPLDHVRIIAFGLNYRGRIQRVSWDGRDMIYDVEYSDDTGAIQRREFFGDELEARP